MTSVRHKQERVYHGFGFTMPMHMSLITNKQLLGFNWFRVDQYLWDKELCCYAWKTKNFYIGEDVKQVYHAALLSFRTNAKGQVVIPSMRKIIENAQLYPGMLFATYEQDGQHVLYLEASYEGCLNPLRERICVIETDLDLPSTVSEFKRVWFRVKYWLEDQAELTEPIDTEETV